MRISHRFEMPEDSASNLHVSAFCSKLELEFLEKKNKFHNEMIEKFIHLFSCAQVSSQNVNFREIIDFYRLDEIKENPANRIYSTDKEHCIGTMTTSNELLDISFNTDDKKHKINNKQCSFSFDKNFEILSINLHLRFGPHNNYSCSSNLYIYFDKYFKPFKLFFESREKKFTIEKTENLMDLDNELFLMKYMYVIDDSLINEILPEIKIVGAYDYNSEDFKRKIEYCELLEY